MLNVSITLRKSRAEIAELLDGDTNEIITGLSNLESMENFRKLCKMFELPDT
jgi:hypothetical protein